jgi:hypothetical protein
MTTVMSEELENMGASDMPIFKRSNLGKLSNYLRSRYTGQESNQIHDEYNPETLLLPFMLWIKFTGNLKLWLIRSRDKNKQVQIELLRLKD